MIVSEQELGAMSSLALAHMGDAVYELLVRTMLCRDGGLTAGRLHRETVRHVAAPAQARAAEKILPMLTGEESAGASGYDGCCRRRWKSCLRWAPARCPCCSAA